MKKLVDGYIRNVRLIGWLYCAVPTVVGFTALFLLNPFRGVYVLRLILALVLGGWVSAFLNAYGLRMYLIKHRSKEGPATVLDGALIGGAIGLGGSLLPALTALIQTNHLEEVKWLIIAQWLLSLVVGSLIGSVLARIGLPHLERD
jgi:hypothetical protein